MIAKARQLLSPLILPVTRIGADPLDSDDVRIRKAVGVFTVAFCGIPFQFTFACFFFLVNQPACGWTLLTVSILMFMGLITFRTSRNFDFTNGYWLAVTLICPLLCTLLLGGVVESGSFWVWMLLAPLIAMITYRTRVVLCFVACIVGLIALVALTPLLSLSNHLSPAIVNALFVFNIFGLIGFFLAFLLYFVRQNEELLTVVKQEQAKSEALLLNILPKEIATVLKQRQGIIADYFAEVSVLFADIVNFTPMSSTVTPIQLVELLNDIFSYFDSLVDKYHLEKIKTVGDCYMVVAGVPSQRADHAKVLVRLALDVQSYVKGRSFLGGKQVAFRIGINSGPVVAGVIGRRKFSYDLWGDAVNTASRMESHGVGGTIQISPTTYELIKDEFLCEPRGTINIKGKGEMPTWLVTGTK